MTYRLICQEGTRKGQEYLVKDSILVGRSRGDLQLKDGKCSNPHAKIFNDSKGLLQIEDLDSTHGTWVNGIKISKITALKAGDKVLLGKSVLEVAEVPAKEVPAPKKETPSVESLRESDSPKGAEATPKDPTPVKELTPIKEIAPVKEVWQVKLEMALDTAIAKTDKDHRASAAKSAVPLPFKEPVVLEFAQGVQSGQTLVFGFGPRSVGLHCNDGLLIEERSPAVAFELHPTPQHLGELRAVAENIQVNGADVKIQKLKEGDRISFGKTALVIRTFKPL